MVRFVTILGFLLAAIVLHAEITAPMAGAIEVQPGICGEPTHHWNTPFQVRRSMGCVARHVGIAVAPFQYKGWHESRFDPHVPCNGTHCGILQIYPPLFSHMVHRYVYGTALAPLSRFDPRDSAVLSARLIKHETDWPWR